MTNINVELFRRYAPKKKLEIINGLNTDELLAVRYATIVRIIREVGKRTDERREKTFRISPERRKSNGWNSNVEALVYVRGNLYLNVYIQTDSTDFTVSERYLNFFRAGDFRGKCFATNRYGDSVPHYFIYSEKDKAEVIRSILLEYVNVKYADRL